MSNRKEILKNLIEYKGDPRELVGRLAQFGWDSDDELVRLEPVHIVNVLRAYVDGSISKDGMVEWANAIEGRDDIEFSDVTKNLVFILANPDLIDQDFSKSWVKEMIEKNSPS